MLLLRTGYYFGAEKRAMTTTLRFPDQAPTESLGAYTQRLFGPCTCGPESTCRGCGFLTDLERAAHPYLTGGA